MTRLVRAPLLHFVVLGAALLAVRERLDPAPPTRPALVIRSADVARLAQAWTEEHGAPPDAAAKQRLVEAAIDEEVLYREAIARGFDRRDEAVRERLVRLGTFVGEETARDRAALERDARRLGLARSDLVIRRHLIDMMRLAAGQVPERDLPSEEELAAELARHADEFAEPAHVRLTHVYFAADRRGDHAAADARAVLDELADAGSAAGAGRGDGFVRGSVFAGSRDDLARVFGAGFAAAVDGAPVRRWFGPVASVYGVHLVWVDAREPRRTPALADVRGRVLHRWLREREEERRSAALQAMRAAYDVRIEDGASAGG
jgi:hypothetical protein